MLDLAGKNTVGPYINSPSQLPFGVVGQVLTHTFTSVLGDGAGGVCAIIRQELPSWPDTERLRPATERSASKYRQVRFQRTCHGCDWAF